jgi:hypothetical protein
LSFKNFVQSVTSNYTKCLQEAPFSTVFLFSGHTLDVKHPSSPGNQKIGQSEQSKKLCSVLGKAAITHLLQPQNVLDDISLASFDHGVIASIWLRKRSRRVTFFFAAYSWSEKLVCIFVSRWFLYSSIFSSARYFYAKKTNKSAFP